MTYSTLIFAHRGANREAAENTRTAFERALGYPIDGMETDVQLSRDEVPVLWHDRYLDKVGFPGKHLDDYDYRELKAMNFAKHFSDSVEREGAMSLGDFVLAYRNRCRLLLEIKNREWEEPSRHELKVRQTLDIAGQVRDNSIIASSFHLPSLLYGQQYRPGFPLVYNMEPEHTVADAEQAVTAHPFLYGLCLHKDTLDQAMVELLRSRDKCIAVYTCNSEDEINRALDLGVDILISDVPQYALQLRDARMIR